MNSPKHSSHHIVAKNIWWTNNKHNLIELKHSQHQALHTLFCTDPLPEKIKKIIWIEYTALREDVIVELLNVLNARWDDLENWYKPECLVYSNK